MNDQWFFYILRCSDSTLYSGITNDIDERIKKHNAGTAAKYTRGRRPVIMVYSETLASMSEARLREEHVKRLPKAKKEQLITKSDLSVSSPLRGED